MAQWSAQFEPPPYIGLPCPTCFEYASFEPTEISIDVAIPDEPVLIFAGHCNQISYLLVTPRVSNYLTAMGARLHNLLGVSS